MAGAGLPAATVDAICARMRLREIPRRRLLYREGEPALNVHAVRSGRVKLFRLDEAGREHVTAVLESGDLFGLESVFGDACADSAATLVPTEICLASAADLKSLFGTIPNFGLDLARYLWDRIARMHERQVHVAGPGAEAKVAGFLLHHLRNGDGKAPVVTHHLSLREIGATLALSAETVCRALSVLKAEGILDGHPGGVRVRDLPRLRRRARPD